MLNILAQNTFAPHLDHWYSELCSKKSSMPPFRSIMSNVYASHISVSDLHQINAPSLKGFKMR